jgi:hypothetical protein
MKESGVGVLKIEESESEVLKIEGSEVLCTDSIALIKASIAFMSLTHLLEEHLEYYPQSNLITSFLNM